MEEIKMTSTSPEEVKQENTMAQDTKGLGDMF
jgi:hypothetical protein